jgi:hypothetical protein
MINDTVKNKFEVNAGSYAILYNKDKTLFLGYYKNVFPFFPNQV